MGALVSKERSVDKVSRQSVGQASRQRHWSVDKVFLKISQERPATLLKIDSNF